MKLKHITTLSLLLSVVGISAVAQPQITREQVQAELRAAIRTGDIIEGDLGLTRYERSPGAYPARPVPAGKTRDEVKAELAEAIRTGNVAFGESSLMLNEQFPDRYPKAHAASGSSEAAVHAIRPAR